jgi:hypothetical protein
MAITPCPWPEMAGGGSMLCPCCAQPLLEKHRGVAQYSDEAASAHLVFLAAIGWTAESLLEHASEALDWTSPGFTDWLRVYTLNEHIDHGNGQDTVVGGARA